MKRIIFIIALVLAAGQAMAWTGVAVGSSGSNALAYKISGDTAVALSINPSVVSKLYACKMADNTTIYACGTNGIIIKSSNGGNSWATLSTGITDTLFSITVSPNNKNIIFACGSAGKIIKSINAGTTWGNLTSGGTKSLRSIKAISNTTIYAVGSDTTILKSLDGMTWGRLTVPANTVGMLNDIDFYSGVGYIAGYGNMLKLVGNSWQRQTVTAGSNIIGLNIVSSGAYAGYDRADSSYYLYNTTGTWESRIIGYPSASYTWFRDQQTIDQLNAFAVLRTLAVAFPHTVRHIIFKTSDGGNTWSNICSITDTLLAIDILSETPINNRYISTLFSKQDIDSTFSYYTPPFLANNFGWFGLYVYSYGTTPRFKLILEGAPTLSDPFVTPRDSIIADSCGMAGYVNQWIQIRMPPGQYGRVRAQGLSGNGTNTTATIKLYSWGQ